MTAIMMKIGAQWRLRRCSIGHRTRRLFLIQSQTLDAGLETAVAFSRTGVRADALGIHIMGLGFCCDSSFWFGFVGG